MKRDMKRPTRTRQLRGMVDTPPPSVTQRHAALRSRKLLDLLSRREEALRRMIGGRGNRPTQPPWGQEKKGRENQPRTPGLTPNATP